MLTRALVERTIADLTAAHTFQRRSRICAAMSVHDMQHVLSVAERERDLIAVDAIREAMAQRCRASTERRTAGAPPPPWWEF
jgi:hypothetical protein